ncbi:MAG TPA: hypothetical protein VN495_03040 [Candidatus Paceibacterota bacterium]|nr:hypothetical protein [Candidatus Paceibacterota bacterium]
MAMEGGIEKREAHKDDRRSSEELVDNVPPHTHEFEETIDPAAPEKIPAVGPKRFFTFMPGKLPASDEGGDYLIDPTADPATRPGTIVYRGVVLRPLTGDEELELSAIMRDPARRKVEGAGSLKDLNAELDAEAAGASGGAAAPETVVPAGGGATAEATGGGTGDGGAEAEPIRDLPLLGPNKFIPHYKPGVFPFVVDFYRHTDLPEEETFTKEEVVDLRRQYKERADRPDAKPEDRLRDPRPVILPERTPERTPERAAAGAAGGGNGGGEEPPRGTATPEGGGGRRGPQPGDVMEGQGGGKEKATPKVSWEIDERRYVGVPIQKLETILGNSFDQKYFRKMVESIGPGSIDKEAMLARFASRSTTAEDRAFLDYASREYSRAMHRAKEAAPDIANPDTLALLAKHHPEMHRLEQFLEGPHAEERAKDVLYMMAATDRAALDGLVDAVKDLKETRNTRRYKTWDKKIGAQAERLGFSRVDYGRAMQLGGDENEAKTKEWLEKHIHDRAGKARRAMDLITGGKLHVWGTSKHLAEKELTKALEITPQWGVTAENPNILKRAIAGVSNTLNRPLNPRTRMLDRLDGSLHAIATYMGDTLESSDIIHAVTQDALEHRRTPTALDAGPTSFTEMQTAERGQETTFAQRIRKEIVEKDPEWKTRSREYRQEQIDQLGERVVQEQKARGGLFAWIVNLLIGKNWKKASEQFLK